MFPGQSARYLMILTIATGYESETLHVKYGVPQGSVLGPLLFSIFCNDLPDIAEDETISMYAGDTTLYVCENNHDAAIMAVNKILVKLYAWCCHNSLTPHPGKTEYMILGQRRFIGPLQDLKLGSSSIKRVRVSRCLGLEVDDQLKWNSHVTELIRSFTQKLNLLRSLHFLLVRAKMDFYFKVIIPFVTYGLLVWGACGETLMDELERVHVRAAKIILKLDWNTPSEQVLATTKWPTLKSMYTKRLLSLISYNSYHGHAPTQLQNLVCKTNHRYNFRNNYTFNYRLPTNFMKNSIVYRASSIWNTLDNDTKTNIRNSYQ